ncbi:hypothetical protein [Verrucosispora sioxanthis]|uniref:hypothetical protein n=1 Tax=Verrucosispora sioxanthis TaxID=2499994 RepID=UPI001C12944E
MGRVRAVARSATWAASWATRSRASSRSLGGGPRLVHLGPQPVDLGEGRRGAVGGPLRVGTGGVAFSGQVTAAPAFGGQVGPYRAHLGAGGVPVRLGLRLVAFGLRRRDLAGGLRTQLGQLPLHPGRRQLGVQRLGQGGHDLVEPVHRLPGPGHLPGQARGVAVPHPAVTGGPLAGTVVVPAVPERAARAGPLRHIAPTVGAGAGVGG